MFANVALVYIKLPSRVINVQITNKGNITYNENAIRIKANKTRSQAVARIADRTPKNSMGHVT